MEHVEKHQRVLLPDNRPAVVLERDQKNRKARCVLDPSDPLVGAGSAARWFDFDDLRPNEW
jgi:hypothetical protein